MKQCKTCKVINQIAEIYKKHADGTVNITAVLKMQPVLLDYTKDNHKKGYLGYKARPFNFCPECGTAVERSKTVFHL